MTRHGYAMPWGAAVHEHGGVSFGLWAPGARRVELALGDGEPRYVPLPATGDGWWRGDVAEAGPGSRYRYRIDGELTVPDPASRAQLTDCDGPSVVIDPSAYAWSVPNWRGRPWHEHVIYELHVGAFTTEGTFRAAAERLEELGNLGVSAVELMPIADFPGRRNWGYDGVLPFAPDRAYGTTDDLKAFIDTAHGHGLAVLLDVVYNHFGPEHNYLGAYAPTFFTSRHATPWGAAINYDTGPDSRWVRRFFIDNALYWLQEYRFDGLRLDAVHAIIDDSETHVLAELAAAVRSGVAPHRHVHLVLENEANESHYLERGSGHATLYDAQWNDDLHHASHVALTGEVEGYYVDYQTWRRHLARALAEGFSYQGDPSSYRHLERRGEPSASLPPTAFVAFLQNHDQIGNRAFGERIHTLTSREALSAATALLLLAPGVPLLFMGQEWAAPQPFPFFCDFDGELAEAVRSGRRHEFAAFPRFSDPAVRARIPDPCASATFAATVLDWSLENEPPHREWRRLHRRLLALRRERIVPLLEGLAAGEAEWETPGEHAIRVRWRLRGAVLTVFANLTAEAADGLALPDVTPLYASTAADAAAAGRLPPYSVIFFLEEDCRS